MGVWGPKGLPEDVLEKLDSAFGKGVEEPSFVAKIGLLVLPPGDVLVLDGYDDNGCGREALGLVHCEDIDLSFLDFGINVDIPRFEGREERLNRFGLRLDGQVDTGGKDGLIGEPRVSEIVLLISSPRVSREGSTTLRGYNLPTMVWISLAAAARRAPNFGS